MREREWSVEELAAQTGDGLVIWTIEEMQLNSSRYVQPVASLGLTTIL